jgi:hypothetical protein
MSNRPIGIAVELTQPIIEVWALRALGDSSFRDTRLTVQALEQVIDF